MSEDMYNDPAPIASEFASADSFRGRCVLIEVTGYEPSVPVFNQPGKFAPRVTATVTTVDGKGRVQIFASKAPTGNFLEGPEHKGVWFGQDRIVKAVAPDGTQSIGRKTLATMDTYKPGKPAGLGNPWGLLALSAEQKQSARDFLAGLTVASAAAPDEDDPFAVK